MAMPEAQFDERENVNEWLRFGFKLAAQSLLHPFEYSKVLIQVRIVNFVYLFNVTAENVNLK